MNKKKAFELFIGLICLFFVFGMTLFCSYELIINKQNEFLKECTNKCGKDNFIIYQEFNDTICGCKWYNMCDNGCIVCDLKKENITYNWYHNGILINEANINYTYNNFQKNCCYPPECAPLNKEDCNHNCTYHLACW